MIDARSTMIQYKYIVQTLLTKLCDLYLPVLDVWSYWTVLVILALQMFICRVCRRKRCVLRCLTDF